MEAWRQGDAVTRTDCDTTVGFGYEVPVRVAHRARNLIVENGAGRDGDSRKVGYGRVAQVIAGPRRVCIACAGEADLAEHRDTVLPIDVGCGASAAIRRTTPACSRAIAFVTAEETLGEPVIYPIWREVRVVLGRVEHQKIVQKLDVLGYRHLEVNVWSARKSDVALNAQRGAGSDELADKAARPLVAVVVGALPNGAEQHVRILAPLTVAVLYPDEVVGVLTRSCAGTGPSIGLKVALATKGARAGVAAAGVVLGLLVLLRGSSPVAVAVIVRPAGVGTESIVVLDDQPYPAGPRGDHVR